MHRNQHRESRKMKKQSTMFQTNKKDKTPETDLKETGICDLPEKEFKITVIRMPTEISKAMYKQKENFNKEEKNLVPHTEMTVVKNK